MRALPHSATRSTLISVVCSPLLPTYPTVIMRGVAAEQSCAQTAQLCAAARARTTPCSLQMLMRRPWGGRFCGTAAENVAASALRRKKWGKRGARVSTRRKRKGYPQTMLEF